MQRTCPWHGLRYESVQEAFVNRARPILCAVDFSETSGAAARLAAALSRRSGAPLTFLHVLEQAPVDPAPLGGVGPFQAQLIARAAELQEGYRVAAEGKLLREASAIANGSVQTIVREGGRPWDAIAEIAVEIGARLVVMGTHGRRGPSRWLLGSVAERTVRAAPCPVLVVPPDWSSSSEDRALRIAVALDLGDAAPLSFVRELRESGPCDVTAIHLYWPPAEAARQERPKPIPLDEPEAETLARLEHDLNEEIGALPGSGEVRLVVKPEWGRLSDPLAREARAARADLLVVGAQGRYSLAPLAGRAGGVLRRLELPVVFVPRDAAVEAHAGHPLH